MDFFVIVSLCGGLALFLYGMSVMSGGLERMAGSKLEGLLRSMTSNPFKSLLLGLSITAVIQSSSAMTVMLVGLVNSGIMQLYQSIGVIMGSNIGTTITAWILSLSGIENDAFWVQLLKPETFSPIFALVGVILIMGAKSERKKSAGSIMVGFAVLMYGMEMMTDAMKPLTENTEFVSMLTAFRNPILGVLAGAAITAIIQSSSASVGILQALSTTGFISYGMAIPIIMGQNIGTCITAMISSIGVSKNAKKVAVVHLSFNLIGTTVCMLLFTLAQMLFPISFVSQAVEPWGIAVCHSAFNIFTTILLFPFARQLEKIANIIISDSEQEEKKNEYVFIDERLLATPSIAVYECDSKTRRMAQLAQDALMASLELFHRFTEQEKAKVVDLEKALDQFEDKLGTYLVRISAKHISSEDSKCVSKQLLTIGDFERIGDHAVNLAHTAAELNEKKLSFSAEASREISILTDALTRILDFATQAYVTGSLKLAVQVEPIQQVIENLIVEIRARHIRRLRAGECTIEMGFILSDMLNNIGRVSDHCSNIAVALIETEQQAYEAHGYVSELTHSENTEYAKAFRDYSERYHL